MKDNCKHQWKRVKGQNGTTLIDTFEKEVAIFKPYECTKCYEYSERMDRRTKRKIHKKEILKAGVQYLIGNRGNFKPYVVADDSILITTENSEIFEKTKSDIENGK